MEYTLKLPRTLGSARLICGKAASTTVPASSITANGKLPTATSRQVALGRSPWMTNRLRPSGGVIIPSSISTTMTTAEMRVLDAEHRQHRRDHRHHQIEDGGRLQEASEDAHSTMITAQK